MLSRISTTLIVKKKENGIYISYFKQYIHAFILRLFLTMKQIALNNISQIWFLL